MNSMIVLGFWRDLQDSQKAKASGIRFPGWVCCDIIYALQYPGLLKSLEIPTVHFSTMAHGFCYSAVDDGPPPFTHRPSGLIVICSISNSA